VTSPHLLPVPHLTEDQASAVRSLVFGASAGDDSPALSEQALLHLLAGPPVRHLIADDHGELVGYAQLEEQPDGVTSIELVAGTDRADEIAADLLTTIAGAVEGPLLVWAHGRTSPVHSAAEAAGLRPARSLLQLRRPLTGPDLTPAESSGEPTPPAGVTIRAFVPGRDDARWLAVNAAAFAHHPEQGGWTQRDLDDRLAADWFDPAGFLVAERDGELIGYHWTKVHPARTDLPPMGEVYVLGVAPAAQGLHLGSVLLRAGLDHLRRRGLTSVLLYVDESNVPAVRLYRSLGFDTVSADVQWARR
jgi:mycothiol synthase